MTAEALGGDYVWTGLRKVANHPCFSTESPISWEAPRSWESLDDWLP